MFIRILPTTLLQIFCENLLYFQVIIKNMKIADGILSWGKYEWVKEVEKQVTRVELKIKIKGNIMNLMYSLKSNKR